MGDVLNIYMCPPWSVWDQVILSTIILRVFAICKVVLSCSTWNWTIGDGPEALTSASDIAINTGHIKVLYASFCEGAAEFLNCLLEGASFYMLRLDLSITTWLTQLTQEPKNDVENSGFSAQTPQVWVPRHAFATSTHDKYLDSIHDLGWECQSVCRHCEVKLA